MLIHGECLEEMDKLIQQGIKVDAIIADIPYGTTACKWDTVIPFDKMWERINKLIKPNGAIVLFGSQPFTSLLITSNIKQYSHQWIWKKNNCSNFLLSKISPLKNFEDVIVFIIPDTEFFNNDPRREMLKDIANKYGKKYIESLFEKEGRYSTKESAKTHSAFKFGYYGGNRFDLMDEKMFDFLSKYIDFGFGFIEKRKINASDKRIYNPQGIKQVNINKVVGGKPKHIGERPNQVGRQYKQQITNYPKSIIKFDADKNKLHPTQKPVALMEYLIKTYTNEGETVLDFTAGSFTTCIAADNTNRKWIGIEMDKEYCKIGKERLIKNSQGKNKYL